MIYSPREDSFLLEREVRKRARGLRVLDMGAGSGIQALAARESGAKKVLAVDFDSESVKLCKENGLNAIKSDLFDNVFQNEKFDLIIFNPPYLPKDLREDSESALATTGGERGDEIILKFLCNVGNYLEKNGKILLLVSSSTPLMRIEKILLEQGFVKKIVSSEKIFMEILNVFEIRKT